MLLSAPNTSTKLPATTNSPPTTTTTRLSPSSTKLNKIPLPRPPAAMAHATATAAPPAPPSLPQLPRSMPPPVLPPVSASSNRKARLDAAIDHFRSEASASGYVVEEVRLRLPVPDIDVSPRVVIAQNGGGSGIIGAPNNSNGAGLPGPHKLPRLPPPLPSTGMKRTVSGSVILNALSPNRAGPRGKFWTTVIADKSNESPPPPSASPASGSDENGTTKSSRRGIPDSHVQLLLSSVAEMPARTTGGDTSVSSSASPSASPAAAPPAPVKKANTGRRGEGRARPATARPFRCAQCTSSFDREGHLRVHILAVHEKKRPFVCRVCDSAFGHSSSLLRHVRTVHQEATQHSTISGADRHFRCSVCSTAFSRVAQLNRHVASQHPLRSPPTPNSSAGGSGNSTPQQEPRRTCRICLAKFPNSDELVKHVKAKHRSEC